MSSIISITILILFLIKIVRDSLFYVWLWQMKEYRIDRMISYLKEDRQMIKNNIFYCIAIVLFILFFIILKDYPNVFSYLVLLFFTLAIFEIIKEVKNKSLKRPKLTFKVALILLLILIFYSLSFLYSIILGYIFAFDSGINILSFFIIYLLFIYLLISVIATLIILLINPFFNFQKKRIIKRAAKKMKGLKKVKVIGITGSYGKTSTKEFLYAILSQKYKVVKTEGNNNTNIGVAYTVLNKVSDGYDYFICEMGAYKIGEIKEMCEIVSPKIGILTGINEQHVDLFGSMENTIKAKFELIESLPKDGMAILNGDNKYIKLRIKNWSEGFSPTVKFFRAEALTPSIKVYQDCVEFIYKNQEFKLNLLGKHYIENVLSAIITAEYLGMSLDEISEAVKKIKPTEFMMRKLDGPNNSIFIDDSYSANPDGVIAALNYIDKAYKDYKKIIVFPGIIELGSKSEEVHKKLFDKIDEVCDVAYIIRIKNQELGIKNNCRFIFKDDFNKITNLFKNNLDEKTVVLFESRGAGVVMKRLKNYF